MCVIKPDISQLPVSAQIVVSIYIAIVYNFLQTGEPLTPEELQIDGTEAQRFNAQKDTLRIR